ncbi:MAG: hypothetical protein A2Z50_03320 [Nitrospirae bacterium RBG_19FT_COMBO_42_15]|nr:MAG: hypothetical protein A2Z50_03320 [Nitrospirae bacterium RBG_19FT_COMBO_42_15]
MKRMWGVKKIFSFMFLALMVSVLLAACGGGGGSDGGGGGGNNNQIPPPATGTISGSVSGTTVVAVNDAGNIVASDDSSGKTPDAFGNYPFTLTGIPTGVNIRVFLITASGVYPMYFDSNDADTIPDTNVFSLTTAATISLGYVNTNDATQSGKAIPANNPINTTGVSSSSENTNIPVSITNPSPPTGASLSQLINDGLDALNNGWIIKARNYFKAAVEGLSGGENQNDADTSRFFYALTRVIALGFDNYSDGNSTDMNRMADILDRFGCDTSMSKRSNLSAISCPDPNKSIPVPMPNDSPTVNELGGFINIIVRPEIEGALSNLNSVSSSFNKAWIFDGNSVESDYGDVLMIRALSKGLLANIDIGNALNINADIDAENNYTNNNIQQFLANNLNFLTLGANPSPLLASAKTQLNSGLDDMTSAINFIRTETDSQNNDFINLGNNTPPEIDEALSDIADAKASMDGATVMQDNDSISNNEFILDMSPFFGGLINPRPLLPLFTGNTPGMFPDVTLNGVLPNAPNNNVNINEDINPADGIPDILQ